MKKDIGRIKPVETQDGLIIYFSDDGKNLYFDYPIEDWTGYGKRHGGPTPIRSAIWMMAFEKYRNKAKNLSDLLKLCDDIAFNRTKDIPELKKIERKLNELVNKIPEDTDDE
jgi:hypothetical protein